MLYFRITSVERIKTQVQWIPTEVCRCRMRRGETEFALGADLGQSRRARLFSERWTEETQSWVVMELSGEGPWCVGPKLSLLQENMTRAAVSLAYGPASSAHL